MTFEVYSPKGWNWYSPSRPLIIMGYMNHEASTHAGEFFTFINNNHTYYEKDWWGAFVATMEKMRGN